MTYSRNKKRINIIAGLSFIIVFILPVNKILINNSIIANNNVDDKLPYQNINLSKVKFEDEKIFDWEKKFINADKNKNFLDDNLEKRLQEVIKLEKQSKSNEQTQITDIRNQNYQKPTKLSLASIPLIVSFPEGDYAQVSFYFETLGGKLKSTYKAALNGFAGEIEQTSLKKFCNTLNKYRIPYFIEEDRIYQAELYYVSRNMNLRPYVWNNLSYNGDEYSSIAILDTGIDDSHNLFSPGYSSGDSDYKMIGWRDEVNGLSLPYDDNGHGSHCAGIAAGNGNPTYDSSGRTVATAAYNLNYTGYEFPSDVYIINWTRFNVTNPGLIELFCEFEDLTPLSDDVDFWVYLYYENTLVDSYEVNSDSWSSTLSYSATSGSLGMYSFRFKMNLIDNTGDGYVSDFDIKFRSEIHWPFDPPLFNSGDPWKGIANDAHLVGVKVLDQYGGGYTSDIIDGIDWVISNKLVYNITTMSLSIGGPSGDVGMINAVNNAVDNGIVTVVSAGNSGPGVNNIGSPGDADNVITVAAMNVDDEITDYSSEGGLSYTGNIVKPDITAPGGSLNNLQIFSADTNDNDAEGAYTDSFINDLQGAQGTSMSAPAVAGASNLLIEAMGGHLSWGYTSTEAKRVKALLLMSATETYPLIRETYGSLDSPELNRGGKDVHEGYGRLNIDIALEAYCNELTLGSSQNGLIKSSLEDTFAKHGIGCHVNLNNGEQCTITLDVPTGADFDLYMYSDNPTSIGEPIMVASSTSSGLGVDEMISYTSSGGNKYYLIAKAISGEGVANISYIVLDHELSVSLDVPDSPEIGNSYIINATVFNDGDNTEIDVDLYLYLNGLIVNSSTISTLSVGASSTINYSWTPIDYGIYNFTVYSPPLFSESFVENNILVKILAIRNITLFDGMYINYTWSIFGLDMPAQFTYSYLSGDMFHVDWYMNSSYHDYWDVDSQTRIMSNGGGSGWYFGDGYHTPIWIFPNVSIGEQLYIASDAEGDHLFEVTDEILYDLTGSGMIEVWVLEDLTLPGGFGLYEKNTGVLISGIFFYSGGMYNYTFSFIDTNLVFDYFILEHDLSVSLEVPEYPEIGNTYVVNATVYNNGIYDESSVNLTLYLDSVIVNSVMVPFLPIGGNEIINYIWTPSEYRTYNFTAFAPPIAGETYITNNVIIELITISTLMNYTMIPNYIFDWIDASGGTELNLDDDGYTSVILPFNFQFYDESFSTIHLSANGYLSFSDSAPYEYINVDFPSGSSSHAYMIAPFWDDLYPPSGGHIYVQSFGSYWVAEWQDIYHIGGPLVGSFQIVLFETGDIVFNYDYLDYTSGGYTCGLNYGLDISYFNVYRDLSVSTDDFSILFTRQLTPWEHDLSVSLAIPEDLEVGETYNIDATVVNNGIYNETNVDLFLYLDTILVNSINIAFLPSGTSHTISYLWTPIEYRTYNFTVYSPPITNETFTSNNYKTKLASLNFITLFDGMYLNHTFSIMNMSGPSRFSYSYISGDIFHVTWDFLLNNTLYHGFWDVDAKTRLITGSTGMTLFPDFTHTPVWIFPNVIIGQIIPISVATEGDHDFIVSRDFTYNLPGYGLVNVWELEDLTYPGGFAWYEKTSGILLNSTFFFFTGRVYNYTFELSETNVLEEGDVLPGDFILLTNAGNPDIDGEFTLVWSDSEGALTYSVYEYSRVITVINESLNLLSTGITGNTIPLSGYSTGTYYFTVVAENNSGVTLSNCIDINVEKPKRKSPGIPGYNLLLLVALISTVNLIILIRHRFNKNKPYKIFQ